MSVVRVPTVALAVPWLDDALTELQGTAAIADVAPGLAWLLARAPAARVETSDWRAWLLEHCEGGVELLRLHAPGPTRRGLALRPGAQQASPPEGTAQTMQAASWACARPVHLGAGLDHLWLDPSPVPLALQEAREIVATLDATVADRGWSLSALDAERWLVGTRDAIECTTSTPWEAAGREVRMHLPEGRDARLVRAVMNEMQMTLHEHPVNQRRDSARRQAVNGVWLWGFGAMHAVAVRSLPVLATDDEWLRELWQLHGNPVLATATDALPGTAAVADPALIALSAPLGATGEDRVRHGEQTIFAPLRRALSSGGLTMHLNSGRSVHAFDRLSARSWRRWLPWRAGRT